MKGNISGTKSFSSSLTKRTLAAKPAPPKIGDFDEDEEGSMNGFDESSSSSSDSSQDSSPDSSSDSESEEECRGDALEQFRVEEVIRISRTV